jgi:hypothetical protein
MSEDGWSRFGAGVVETPDADLVSGMAWLESTYTIRLDMMAGSVPSNRTKAR